MSAAVRFELDVRGLLISLRPGPNYCREPLQVLIARGSIACSARPSRKCSRRMRDSESVAEAPFYRPRMALTTTCVLYIYIYTSTHLFSGGNGLTAFA